MQFERRTEASVRVTNRASSDPTATGLRGSSTAPDVKGRTERRVHVANLGRVLQMSASAELVL